MRRMEASGLGSMNGRRVGGPADSNRKNHRQGQRQGGTHRTSPDHVAHCHDSTMLLWIRPERLAAKLGWIVVAGNVVVPNRRLTQRVGRARKGGEARGHADRTTR